MNTHIEQTELLFLEALPLALVVFKPDGQLIWASAPAQNLLGHFDDFASALDAYTSDTRFDDWHKILFGLSDSDRPLRFLHINCHDQDGTTKIMNLTICRLASDSARPDRAIVLLEDTTALAELDQQLAHLERLAALGKFSAELAHELNNPLDGILRYVNLAIRLCDKLDDKRPAEYLLQARRGIMRMIRIITELLEFSRTSDAGLVEDRIDHIIDEALNSLEPRATEASVSFRRQFAPNLPFIRAGNLFQVFCNIIRNAIEAMPTGGTLTITAEIADEDLRISFADEGHGLPPGDAERIFEPFFTTKPAGQGTGLGLAICREVIEKYQGTIHPANRPGGGAVITITIPLSSCQTAADLHLPRPLLPPEPGR